MAPVRLLILAGLLAGVTLAGCQQVLLQADGCLGEEAGPALAACLKDPAADITPEGAGFVNPPPCKAVSTVVNPEAPRRDISLAECIALALENGRTGEFYDRPGSDRWTSVSGLIGQQPPGNFTDQIRVFAFDPGIARTEVVESLAKFDAFWQTVLDWNHVGPPRNLLPEQVPPVGILNNNGLINNVQFRTELLKPLVTGGLAGLTFRTDYERANFPARAPVLNPAYQPGVDLTFEQSLLQGAGTLLGLLRETRPESFLHPGLPPGGRVPGILITRLAHDQAELEFERRVQELLFRVEEAYWGLYCAYWDLYSRETGMRLSYLAWLHARARYRAGGVTDEELAEAEEQYHFFRSQRLEALGRGTPGRPGVLEAERRLRYVVGLPPEDGTRLIPADAPAATPVEPDWCAAVAEARANRPELIQVSRDIGMAQLALVRARNLLLPDLRFISRYGLNGVGGEFGESFTNLGHAPFSDWELRLQLLVPIGFREAHAEVARARLQLAQRLAFLRDQEAKVVLSLQRSQRELVQFREEIATRRSQRAAAAVQVRTRYAKYLAGRGQIEFLLQAQRTWADALRDEYLAVCNYNVALADFERQKGTIMRYDNVTVAEAVPAACASGRASERLRRLHEAAAVVPEAGPRGSCRGPAAPLPGNPFLPDLVDPEAPPKLSSLDPGRPLPEKLDRSEPVAGLP